jgi:hypothetical protein
MADTAFSIDAANALANKTGYVPIPASAAVTNQPAPVGTAVTGPTAQPFKPVVNNAPTADLAPGVPAYAMGAAPQQVPTVGQVRAGFPIVQAAPLPPQQQGVVPPPLTHNDLATSIVDRVSQGFRNLLGISGANQSAAPQPVIPTYTAAAQVGGTTPAAQAAIDADTAKRKAAATSPNIFQVRKNAAIASTSKY